MLDEHTFGPLHQPLLGQLVPQAVIFRPQQIQPPVTAGGDLHTLPELDGGEGLAHHQHAVLLQFGRDLVGGAGLGQQNDPGTGLLHRIGAQLVAEFIGQRRVDDDDLKIPRIHLAARLAAAGHDDGARVAQLRDVPGKIFIGVGPC